MVNVHFLGPILLVAFAAFILGQPSSPNHSSGSPSQRDNSHGLTQQGKGHGAKEAPGQQIKNKDNSMPTIKKGTTTKSQKKVKVRHAKNNGGIGTLGKSKRQKRFLTEIFGNSLDKSKNNAEESELKREGFGIVPEKVKGKAEKTNERAAEKAGEKNGNGGRQKRFDERILGNSTFEPPVLNLGPNWPPPQYRHISFSDASNKRGQQKDEAEKRKKRSISQEAEAEKRKKRSIRQEDEAEKRKKRNIAATGKSGRPRGPILPE